MDKDKDQELTSKIDALLSKHQRHPEEVDNIPILTERIVVPHKQATGDRPAAEPPPAFLESTLQTLSHEIFTKVFTKLEGELAARVEERLTERLAAQVGPAVTHVLTDLRQEVANEIGDAINAALTDQLRKK